MATTVKSLIVGRIVGEVVDLFVPSVSMSVSFPEKSVNNGCNVNPSVAVNAPKVKISGQPDYLYTLVMIDPDAPSPSNPSMREWIHWYDLLWLVVDIPGGEVASNGKELLPYEGPQPMLGIHRYVFVLYQQKVPFPPMSPFNERAYFNTRFFAANYNLDSPVATLYFNSKREPKKKEEKKEKKGKKRFRFSDDLLM